MDGNKAQKLVIARFWKEFNSTHDKVEKFKILLKYSKTKISYKKQKSLIARREEFNRVKKARCGLSDKSFCFVCGKNANLRHHIISLKFGGINSWRNIIPLCTLCHESIHPYLRKVHKLDYD